MVQRLLACSILVSGGFAVAAPVDPVTALDDPAAAKKLIPEGATCVPRTAPAALLPQLQLGLVDGAPVLCAVSTADSAPVFGTLACWDVDVAAKQLVARAPRLLPGQLVRSKLVKGCTHGLCLPAAEKPPSDPYVAVGIDDGGAHAVVVAGETAYFYDRAKQWAFTSKIALSGTPPDLFVGGALMSVFQNGPTETVQVSSPRPRKSADPGGKPFDLYLGSMTPARTGHVLLVQAGLGSVMDYEVATDKLTSIRKVKLARQVAVCTLAMDESGSCKQSVYDTKVAPYSGAAFVPYKDGYLARLSGDRRAGELIVLDKKLKERPKTKFSAFCAKPK